MTYKYGKNNISGSVTVSATQNVITVDGREYVLMGSLCKILNLSDSTGMGIVRKSPTELKRIKIPVNKAGVRSGALTVAIPLTSLGEWTRRICPIFVDSLNADLGSEIRSYTYASERKEGITDAPSLPGLIRGALDFGPTEQSIEIEKRIPKVERAFSGSVVVSGLTTMSSRDVADLTGKDHRHVMADIRKMLKELDLDAPNFQHIYFDSMNRSRTEYMLPRRECDILVSGYSIKYRAAIVDRWAELESADRAPSKPMSQVELIVQQANALLDHENRVNALEAEASEIRKQAHEIKSQIRALTEGEEYFTATGYCNLKGIKADSNMAASIGKKAAAECRSNGWNIGKANHPRWGTVNSYPVEALKIAISEGGVA